MTVQPPRVATWLLRNLTPSPNLESLIGDLDEQFARGRSTAWYWRQALSAITAGVARDLRDHKLQGLAVALVTWVIVLTWVETTWALYLWVFNKWVYVWAATPGSESKVFFRFWVAYGAGLQVVWCVGCAMAGWVTARMQRGHAATIACACVAAELPLTLWWGLPLLLRASHLPVAYSVPMRVCASIILFGMPTVTMLGSIGGAQCSLQSPRSLRRPS